jgi:hypothetical protein
MAAAGHDVAFIARGAHRDARGDGSITPVQPPESTVAASLGALMQYLPVTSSR